jgi:hypothetical protein
MLEQAPTVQLSVDDIAGMHRFVSQLRTTEQNAKRPFVDSPQPSSISLPVASILTRLTRRHAR